MSRSRNMFFYLSSFIVCFFFCLSAAAGQAESIEAGVFLKEEPQTSDSEIEYISLEQKGPSSNIENNSSGQEKEPRIQGKSILNITGTLAPLNPSAHIPKTSLEAKALGWKEKSVETPRPVSSLIKEVPMEIIEKKARAEKRRMKSGNVQTAQQKVR